jgi:AraC family transcriptional regulator
MQSKPVFGIEDTHRILHQFQADIRASSEGLGWSSAFASVQRERAYEGKLHALSDSLMVLHRGGPVDITYTVEGKSVGRHIPKGGVFFLPARHECDVALHAALDSTHIYLRSDLFVDVEAGARNALGGLAPMFGENDAVLAHLAAAIGDTIIAGLPASSLFVDPIVRAIANRFIAINYHTPAAEPGKQTQRLTHRQMQRIREFVEANLETDIRLEMMAGICGRSTEYFVRNLQGDRRRFTVSICAQSADRARQGAAWRRGLEHRRHRPAMRLLAPGTSDAHVPPLHRRNPGPLPEQSLDVFAPNPPSVPRPMAA